MRVACHFKIRFQTWCTTLRFSSRGKGTFAIDGLRQGDMHGLAEQGKLFLTTLGVKTHEIQYPEFFSQTNSWASGHHLLHFTQAVADGFLSPGSQGTYAVPEKWDEFVGNLIGLLANIGVGGELAPVVLSGEAEAQTPAQVVSYHFVSASCHSSPPCCQLFFIASFVRARDGWPGLHFFIQFAEPSLPRGENLEIVLLNI